MTRRVGENEDAESDLGVTIDIFVPSPRAIQAAGRDRCHNELRQSLCRVTRRIIAAWGCGSSSGTR